VSLRIHNLQALRGVACLLVFVFHLAFAEAQAGGELAKQAYAGLVFGQAGVDLFFVLSGFVITWVNADILGDHTRLVGYVGRRLWRIFPVYWVCWCAALPLVRWLGVIDLGQFLNPGKALRLLALLPTSDYNPVLPQAWTLNFEIVFYLAFAVFLFVPRRAFVPLLGLWLAGVVAALGLPPNAAMFTVRAFRPAAWLLHPFVLEFLLGCFAAVAIRRGWTGGARTILMAGLLGFAAGAVVTCMDPVAASPARWRVLLFGVPSSLIVFGAVAVERSQGWVLPRWLQICGDASYPIYLVHMVVLDVVRKNLGGLSDNWLGHVTRICLLIIAGLGTGFVVHAVVEQPLMNLVRRRRPVQATAVTPIARAA
jgi:exopolysaccharide production protein ExoZ